MKRLARLTRSIIIDEDGATLVEYGLMLALIAAVCAGIVATIGGPLQAGFANASAGM